MPMMKIVVSHLDREIPGMDDFITSFVLLSKEKGVKCQLTSPNGAMVEADKGTLLEILDKVDSDLLSAVANKMKITVEFG
ncbi:MAG TPA: hypothetical protein VLB01_02290 [Thermodesulfobacteriota bacterium]|nr:hypothetical protein [Thermodesulfobacteriota bacterium]